MEHERQIELARLPSMAGFFWRALATRKPRLRPGVVPQPLTVRLPEVAVDQRRLAAYRHLLGFAQPGVPVTFPQILAGPLNAELMLAPEFPFKLAGIIQLRSVINAHRALDADEPLALSARLAAHREVRQGVEIDLETEITAGQEIVWRGVNTVLARTRPASRRRPTSPAAAAIEVPADAQTASWRVPAHTGRRYARVSGDYNPIHLFGVTARLFGFSRPIAHGLWSLARCLAQLESQLAAPPLAVEVEFRRPLLMPAEVLMINRPVAGGIEFALHPAERTGAFLHGRVVTQGHG